MKLLSVLSTSLDTAKRLVAKVWNGKSDTRTAKQYGPYGFESNPIKGMIAIYSRTELDGSEAIIGYLNKNCTTGLGESRVFSTDENGAFKFGIWLKSDGTALIGTSETPGSYTNFAVKYNELKQENDKLKSTVDSLVQKWNAFCAAYVPGSPTVTGSPPTLATSTVIANTSDFSLIKNEKIKTN